MVRRIILIPLILIVAYFIAPEQGRSQDPIFSQFYANPLYLNPAFAGTNICPRLIINYRNQWPSIPGGFITYNASYDQYFGKLSGGLGLLAMSDQAGEGALTHNFIGFMYSYRLQFDDQGKYNLTFALQSSYYTKSINWDKLKFGDQIDERDGFTHNRPTQTPKVNEHTAYPDFSMGTLYFTDKFYIGVATHHLTQPYNSLYPMPDGQSVHHMKYTIQTGYEIQVGGKRKGIYQESYPYLFPSLIYQQQHQFHQINYGIYYHHTPMTFGIWYRQFHSSKYGQYSDALTLLAGFEYDKMKIGYSYDITVSGLTNGGSGGAHEISLTLKFNCPERGPKYRAIKCPVF